LRGGLEGEYVLKDFLGFGVRSIWFFFFFGFPFACGAERVFLSESSVAHTGLLFGLPVEKLLPSQAVSVEAFSQRDPFAFIL